MIEPLSLSIFTIEADRKPVIAFAVKKFEEADTFFRDERVRTKLRSANSGGVPLCDDFAILRIRLANAYPLAQSHKMLTSEANSTRKLCARAFWPAWRSNFHPRHAGCLSFSLTLTRSATCGANRPDHAPQG
jgi:hypothetical protein